MLVDVIDAGPTWSDWSAKQSDLWASRGPLVIDDIVCAELSIGFASVDPLDRIVDRALLDRRRTLRDAQFLAATAGQRYRRRGGTRVRVLPDFFIGAHAAVPGNALADARRRRYRVEFRTPRLVSPDATTKGPR